MNLTLSVDEHIVARARKASEARGKSLNQVLREYLEELAGLRDPRDVVEELKQSWKDEPGHSGGWRFNRKELHDRTNLS